MSTSDLYITFNVLFWLIIVGNIFQDITYVNQLKSKTHTVSFKPWPWFNAAILFTGAACLATTPDEAHVIRIVSASGMLIAAISTAFRTKRVLEKYANHQPVPENYHYWRCADVGICILTIIVLMF